MTTFLAHFVQPNFATFDYDGEERHLVEAEDIKSAWDFCKLMEPGIIEKNRWDASAGLLAVRKIGHGHSKRLRHHLPVHDLNGEQLKGS